MPDLISSPRNLLSPDDATYIYESRRLRQSNHRNSCATLFSSQAASRDSQPVVRGSSPISKHNQKLYAGIEIPHLTRTPWEAERYKRHSTWKRTTTGCVFSSTTFQKLPREVYDCVIEQLEQIHLGQDQSCKSCYQRDLYHLSLTSRAWNRAATLQMYRNVFIAVDDHASMPKLKIRGASRLKLLRRTLRKRRVNASMVRELHMPDFHTLYHNATIEREEIVNLVASLVMACPNLERLVGFHIPYTHSFDRLSHALSTRTELRERLWYFADDDLEVEDKEEDDPIQGYYHAACDPTEHFLHLNSKQASMTTLVLHQEEAQAADKLTFRAIIGTLRQFPMLRHLALSGLSSTSFSNIALNALPPYLQSLRLEDLPGINDKGLQRFATSSSAITLESVTLVNLEINQIETISAFLSLRLAQIKRFTLTQHKAPTLPPGKDTPIFQSSVLDYIHWEFRSQAGPPPTLLSPFNVSTQSSFPFVTDEPIPCLATSILAHSIIEGHFPSLRTIRAPHDPQGILQALCKPLATGLLPADASIFTTLPRLARSSRPGHEVRKDHTNKRQDSISMLQSPPSTRMSLYSQSDDASTLSLKEFLTTTAPNTRTDSVISSPQIACSVSVSHEGDLYKRPIETPLVTTLTPMRSRLAAQSRILAARRRTQMEFKVTDPTGETCVDTAIRGFLGDLKSQITYVLRPDRDRILARGSSWDGEEDDDELNEWITTVGDVVGKWHVGSDGGRGYGGCRHSVGEASLRKAVEVRTLF